MVPRTSHSFAAKSNTVLNLPDPIFALIEAEERAHDAFEAAIDRQIAAETAFEATGLDRHPRVQTGTMTTIVDQDGVTLPAEDWLERPLYANTRSEIEDAFRRGTKPFTISAGARQVTQTETRCGTLEDALAAVEADKAEIEAARPRYGIEAADRAETEAMRAHDAAALAVFTATPTTKAGLLAMLDLYDGRDFIPHSGTEDLYDGLLAAVRSILSREA